MEKVWRKGRNRKGAVTRWRWRKMMKIFLFNRTNKVTECKKGIKIILAR
jgi:hypothetical protein